VNGLECATKSTMSTGVRPTLTVHSQPESLILEMETPQNLCDCIVRRKMNKGNTSLYPIDGVVLSPERASIVGRSKITSIAGSRALLLMSCQRPSKMLSKSRESSADDISGLIRCALSRMTKMTGSTKPGLWRRSTVWLTLPLLLPPLWIPRKDSLIRGQSDGT
jgi:hypothetical protein